jgi:hypothetical protein
MGKPCLSLPTPSCIRTIAINKKGLWTTFMCTYVLHSCVHMYYIHIYICTTFMCIYVLGTFIFTYELLSFTFTVSVIKFWPCWFPLLFRIWFRIARFSLIQYTKTGKRYTELPQRCQMVIKYTNWPQNISNDNKIFRHFSFQGPPKLIFSVRKYTIWQPWFDCLHWLWKQDKYAFVWKILLCFKAWS